MAVEIKMRSSGDSCKSSETKVRPVHGASVFFETFEGAGWHKKAQSRLLENGWNHWYASHRDIDSYRADLFRLCGGKLVSVR